MSKGKSDQTESDVEAEHHESRSRASRDEDGAYVGRKSGDDDFDAGMTGAEARSQDG
ncbi:hypothetical protein [Mycobacterium sp. 1423905.2]|uniref:hypothetical protein n=1 Tax=Mycobacterium sp. 1423905.2 TaxID=1856859 RepID=UPI00155FF716|nr:hypothetical protein [Mycobacterium sp. 1423905.2]